MHSPFVRLLRRQHRPGRVAFAAALSLTTVVTVGGAVRADQSSHWSAWSGCWQLLEERVGEAGLARGERVLTALDEVLVCVAPAAEAPAATLRTYVKGSERLQQTIVADGRERPLAEPQCDGTERTRWSADGTRLFAKVALTCADGASRQVSGLSFLAADRTWVDVQVVTAGGRDHVRVRRYRRAPGEALSALSEPARAAGVEQLEARARSARSFTLEEVIESTAQVSPRAVEAALAESNASFTLSGTRLVQLADGGVPPSTIDLMIALSYPEKFVVETRASGSGLSTPAWPIGLTGTALDYLGPFYAYSYSPFGYGYWGGYDPVSYGGAGFVVVDPRPLPSGHGRVVDGSGYTRVHPREPEPAPASSGGVSGGQSAGSASGGGAGAGGASSGGVSSQGYSGGGGGGAVAIPRPPGTT